MSPKRMIVALALGLALTGCNQYWERKETVVLSAGDAVATNVALQVPDPWPRNVRDTNIPMDGEKARVGYERYRRGEIGLGRSSGASGPSAPSVPTQ